MADKYGPFAGSPWAETDWFRFASLLAPDGVLHDGDLPLTTNGLVVTLGLGRAWVAGAGFERSGTPDTNTVVANTHSTYSRCDRMVLRRSLSNHTVVPTIIEGTPAAQPTPPDISLDENGDWDLRLWSFWVPPNSGTNLTNIFDERITVGARPVFVSATEPNYAPDGSLWFQINS